MDEKYLHSKCLENYFEVVLKHCPDHAKKTKHQRYKMKRKMIEQLKLKVRVNMEDFQVNSYAKINKNTKIKGSSVAVDGQPQQQQQQQQQKCVEQNGGEVSNKAAQLYLMNEKEEEERRKTRQNTKEQQQQNYYDLDISRIDEEILTTTTSTNNMNTNLQPNVINDTPKYDVQNIQYNNNNQNNEDNSTKPKVIVFNMPRILTTCMFESSLKFDMIHPEDCVQVLAPQVRELVQRRDYEETLQATQTLEQLIAPEYELPSTSRNAPRKRKRCVVTTKYDENGQPMPKKKRGRKTNLEKEREAQRESLLQYYENNEWIFQDHNTTPRAEGTSLYLTETENQWMNDDVNKTNGLLNVPLPMSFEGFTSLETIEKLLTHGNDAQQGQNTDNANNLNLTLNEIFYATDIPDKIMNEENSIDLVNKFGETFVNPEDEAFRVALSMPIIDENNDYAKTIIKTPSTELIAEEGTDPMTDHLHSLLPNKSSELETNKETLDAVDLNQILDANTVAGFNADAQQLMNAEHPAEVATQRKEKPQILSVINLPNFKPPQQQQQQQPAQQNSLKNENGDMPAIQICREPHVQKDQTVVECLDIQNVTNSDGDEPNFKCKPNETINMNEVSDDLPVNRIILKCLKRNDRGGIVYEIKTTNKHKKEEKMKKNKENTADIQMEATTMYEIACEKEEEDNLNVNKYKTKKLCIKLQRIKMHGGNKYENANRRRQPKQQQQLTDICKNIGNNVEQVKNNQNNAEGWENQILNILNESCAQCIIPKHSPAGEEKEEDLKEITASQTSLRLHSPDIFDEDFSPINVSSPHLGHQMEIAKVEEKPAADLTEKSADSCPTDFVCLETLISDEIDDDCLILNDTINSLENYIQEKEKTENKLKEIVDIDQSNRPQGRQEPEHKSILELEMQLNNNEIDDDFLSLSASSLSDLEMDAEEHIKENQIVKDKSIQEPRRVRKTRFSPLVPNPQLAQITKTTPSVKCNFDAIMSPTTTFKTLLSTNFKIPKLQTTPKFEPQQQTSTTQTINFKPQQQQQQQALQNMNKPQQQIIRTINTIMPTTTTTQVNTAQQQHALQKIAEPQQKIVRTINTIMPTTTTTTQVNTAQQQQIVRTIHATKQQQEDELKPTSTTTTTQDIEKILPKIRIGIVNKNTKYEQYQIVTKTNDNESQSTQREQEEEDDDPLTKPLGQNFGVTNLVLARVFGIECWSDYVNNETTKSHTLLSQEEVQKRVSVLCKENFDAAYRFAKSHRELFGKYVDCFRSTMISRKNINWLLSTINDCRLYPSQADDAVTGIFTALRQCDWDTDMSCKAILTRLLENANEYDIDVLHAALRLIMCTRRWTRFTVEIERMLEIKNFHMIFNFVEHMVETCLTTQVDQCHRILTLRCISKLNADLHLLGTSPNCIAFLQLQANNSGNIPPPI